MSDSDDEKASTSTTTTTPAPSTSATSTGPEKLKPTVGNGSKTDIYAWSQTLSEIDARIPVSGIVKPKQQILIEMKSDKVKITVKGQVLLDDTWLHPIKANDSVWTFEGGVIILTIVKKNQMEWWSKLVSKEPEIDTQKIVPENSKVEDLDDETQTMVRKMQEDQRRKMMGLPSTEEEQKRDSLKKFMALHPEMDFSNAKIG